MARHQTNRRATPAALAVLSMLSVGAALGRAAEPLPSYAVDIGQTSVSGLSSGAYMAGQFHVAHSGTLVGVGLVAGGPYYCAEGILSNALNRCMETTPGEPDPNHLLALAQDLARQARIDDPANLAGDAVYVFSGTKDETVRPGVAAKAVDFYRLAGLPETQPADVPELAAGHAMITGDYGAACGATDSPYINDCDYDQAGAILEHIHGPLEPPAAQPGGRIIEFDQGEFIFDPPSHGMNQVGYAYVPESCAENRPCTVHIAFHGCRQTTADIGRQFFEHAGYNAWADANDIIVLYPQAWASRGNPRACWDWWGYDDAEYHTKAGRQMAAVMGMLRRLAGLEPDGYCRAHEDSNVGHWWANRAEWCGLWSACAKESNDNLGFLSWFSHTTLYETRPGGFGTTPCVE